MKKSDNLLKSKLLYTILILLIYLLCREIPLYMVDVSAYMHTEVNAEAVLLQTISGDLYQCSLLALGIMPYMLSSLIVQIVSAFRKPEIRNKISPKKTNYQTLVIMSMISIVMAAVQVQELHFSVEGNMLIWAKCVALVEMIAGAAMIMYLSSGNKKYGIGGQSALILINIVDGIGVTVRNSSFKELLIPLLISIVVVYIVVFMENAEKRIPLQRISIHNIYADKNYLAIKMNPIGVMPAMFSMAVFMLVQLLITLIGWLIPENGYVLWLQAHVILTEPAGVVTYILVLYILTIGFSRVFINPGELTEQFLKSGDSIQNLHAGKDTRRYLSRTITSISFLSATIMGACLCIPLILQLTGSMDGRFVSIPSSVMLLAGTCCNLGREVEAIRDLEAYEPFM